MFLHLSHCGPSLCLMLVRLIWFGVDKDSVQKSMGVPYSVGILIYRVCVSALLCVSLCAAAGAVCSVH